MQFPSLTTIVEPIFLLLFMAVVLVSVAGGNPDSVIRPAIAIAGSLLQGLLTLTINLLTTGIQLAISGLTTALKALGELSKSHSSRLNK